MLNAVWTINKCIGKKEKLLNKPAQSHCTHIVFQVSFLSTVAMVLCSLPQAYIENISPTNSTDIYLALT